MTTGIRVVFDCNTFLQALAADAKLISRDNDLLDLMNSSRPEAADFQKLCPSLRILNPVAFLREIGA